MILALRILPLVALSVGGFALRFVRRRNLQSIYEQLTASEAVCRVRIDGVIVRANRRMHTLCGLDVVAGRSLASLFDTDAQTFIQDFFANSEAGARYGRDAQIMTSAGPHTVRLELGRVTSRGSLKGFYARVRDIAKRELEGRRVLHQIFDAAPIAIARIAPDGQLTYLNPKAMEIVGLDTFSGVSIWDLVPEGPNRERVRIELDRRMAGGSSEYELVITRASDRTPIALRVIALPDVDNNDGHIVGSFVLFKSIAEQQALEAMRHHMETIETIADPRRLLDAVMKEARALIPFDEFTVSFYSEHNRQARILYGSLHTRAQRWWTMRDDLVEFSRRSQIIDDLDQFFADPRYAHLKNEPGTKEFVDAGIRSSMFRPILRGDRVVAATSLLSRTPKKFNASHQRLFDVLPIDAAVLMAFHAQERRDLEFRLRLLQDLAGASNDILRMAELLVEGLARHYEWSNVSLFRVDRARKTLRLLRQTADSEERRLPPDYTQPIDAGVMGCVAARGKAVNIGNVATDPEFKDVFSHGISGTVSELCVPINADGRVRWLLNIEDVSANAFAQEELSAIEQIAAEVGELLHRASTLHFLNNVVDRASDAVVVTDAGDSIIRANDAAVALLGRDRRQLRGSHLVDYIKDLATHSEIDVPISSATMTVQHEFRGAREVTLSASPLPDDLGGRVFIFRDRLLQLRVEELDTMRKTYYEIAMQTRTPLALAFTWLRRLQADDEHAHDTIERCLKQLRKVELTYDRLVLFEHAQTLGCPYNEILLTVGELITSVRDQLPTVDAQRLVTRYSADLPPVRGDLFQLEFCVASLISYLLRLAPQDGQVHISAKRQRDRLLLDIRGAAPLTPPTDALLAQRAQVSRAVNDIALGEPIIREIVEEHHKGHFESLGVPPSQFRVELRIAEEIS